MNANVRIGLDVGGTFTDLFLVDEGNGRTVRHKLPSTPDDPYRAPIQGIEEILLKSNLPASAVGFVGLGTTVATNALLERKGAVTGLITTRGFRDLLELQRQRRPHTYDLFKRKSVPLVSRDLRLEVTERIGPDGEIIHPLAEGDLDGIMRRFQAAGVRSIAVCLLNAYANPVHEERLAELIRSGWPEIAVTTSQELTPEFREYERLSSTVANAFLMPVMKRYLTLFAERVRAMGVPVDPLVMSSGGGVIGARLAGRRPIELLLSGPSGGVSGAVFHATDSGHPNIITFDMGGTSTDVCLIQAGKPEITHSRVIAGLPIKTTAIDIHTVGAGGSSIAWIDEGGMLRVGPHSAGANPGPACYGRQGALPTVTDANVVLGRMNQEFLLDGALPIDAGRSHQAIREHIADPKGLELSEAAAAILAVSIVNIAQAIRYVSVERGLDPADFTLVAFGGAGPLHAAAVARELKMRVLVPSGPGVLCAMGVLTKDVQIDINRTRLLKVGSPDAARVVGEIFDDLEIRASKMLESANSSKVDLIFERFVDARYVGQSFELTVEVPVGGIAPPTVEVVAQRFHQAHCRLYGYDRQDNAIEFVTYRTRARLAVPRPRIVESLPGVAGAGIEPVASRLAWFETSERFDPCPVYARASLPFGTTLRGPAILEQMDTTTVVPPDFQVACDAWGNLILTQLDEGQ